MVAIKSDRGRPVRIEDDRREYEAAVVATIEATDQNLAFLAMFTIDGSEYI